MNFNSYIASAMCENLFNILTPKIVNNSSNINRFVTRLLGLISVVDGHAVTTISSLTQMPVLFCLFRKIL